MYHSHVRIGRLRPNRITSNNCLAKPIMLARHIPPEMRISLQASAGGVPSLLGQRLCPLSCTSWTYCILEYCVGKPPYGCQPLTISRTMFRNECTYKTPPVLQGVSPCLADGLVLQQSHQNPEDLAALCTAYQEPISPPGLSQRSRPLVPLTALSPLAARSSRLMLFTQTTNSASDKAADRRGSCSAETRYSPRQRFVCIPTCRVPHRHQSPISR